MGLLDRYKLVVRDPNGKVKQIHEAYKNDVHRVLIAELETNPTYTVAVTKL